jgi:hypothetical protein
MESLYFKNMLLSKVVKLTAGFYTIFYLTPLINF